MLDQFRIRRHAELRRVDPAVGQRRDGRAAVRAHLETVVDVIVEAGTTGQRDASPTRLPSAFATTEAVRASRHPPDRKHCPPRHHRQEPGNRGKQKNRLKQHNPFISYCGYIAYYRSIAFRPHIFPYRNCQVTTATAMARISHRRVGRGCASFWWGCANRSIVVQRFVAQQAELPRPKPHQDFGLLDPPYSLREMVQESVRRCVIPLRTLSCTRRWMVNLVPWPIHPLPPLCYDLRFCPATPKRSAGW